MKVFLTGATGFIGGAVLRMLLADERYYPFVLLRPKVLIEGIGADQVIHGQLEDVQHWGGCLTNIDTVIHVAAKTQAMRKSDQDLVAEYRKINVKPTLELAKKAAAAGVKRFIFLSSVKVNGENSELEKPFKAFDNPMPKDPYGNTKLEAEQALMALTNTVDMEVVIIRPPLVYGPDVKGNFLSLLFFVQRRIPLPMGAIKNKRSLVFLENLVDLIRVCMSHPEASNRVFLVSDDEDVSTTDLLRSIGCHLNKRPFLIPLPTKLILMGFALIGKMEYAKRLVGDLQVDISETKHLLEWKPPVSLDQGVKKTAAWYSIEKGGC